MTRGSNAYGIAQVHDVHSVDERLHYINRQVWASIRDPEIRSRALQLVSGCPEHGNEAEACEIQRVFWFVKQNIQYRQDPYTYDLYATARRVLQVGAGDCDCHCALTTGLLGTIGYIPGARVVSPDGKAWHIYACVGAYPRLSPTVVIPLDTTQPQSYPGWEPPRHLCNHMKQITFAESGPIIEVIR